MYPYISSDIWDSETQTRAHTHTHTHTHTHAHTKQQAHCQNLFTEIYHADKQNNVVKYYQCTVLQIYVYITFFIHNNIIHATSSTLNKIYTKTYAWE